MARKSDIEQTEQPAAASPTTSTTTSSGVTQQSDEGMRHETHGELPSERPAADF